ncbi:MAG: aminopeptidase P family protein [Asgard group archaeon]|nr:aminopeptidase P family protein [Asgard group archaeon]
MLKERQKRLQELLAKNNSECVILFPGVDLFYVSGLDIHPSERLTVSIVPQKGEPIFICPSFEESRFKRNLETGDIRTWQEDEDPFKLLSTIIKELDIQAKQISLDNKLWFEWFLRIKKELPEAKFVNSTNIIQAARLTKSIDELAIMREATRIAAESITRSFVQIEVGMTETIVANIVKEELAKEGLPAFNLVQSGPNSALPHGSPTGRVIEKNDVVLIDAGPIYKGYVGDITMTSVIGEPSDKFKEIYEIVFKANRAAYNASKIGVKAEDVDKAARDVITKAGYGKYFTHRLGHGIGIEVHEPPYMVSGNQLILQEGMCHTIEPGIYIEGEFGVRIEDNVFVGKDGCEFLFDVQRRLWEL